MMPPLFRDMGKLTYCHVGRGLGRYLVVPFKFISHMGTLACISSPIFQNKGWRRGLHVKTLGKTGVTILQWNTSRGCSQANNHLKSDIKNINHKLSCAIAFLKYQGRHHESNSNSTQHLDTFYFIHRTFLMNTKRKNGPSWLLGHSWYYDIHWLLSRLVFRVNTIIKGWQVTAEMTADESWGAKNGDINSAWQICVSEESNTEESVKLGSLMGDSEQHIKCNVIPSRLQNFKCALSWRIQLSFSSLD